jgi:undecaprenyl-diphosphatase
MDHVLRLGQKGGPFLIVLLALVLFAARRRSASILLLVGAGGAAVLGVAAKAATGLISNEASDFPSGHASGSAGLVAALILLLWEHKRRVMILLAGPTSVGLYGSLLVATVWHTPSEVVGGWCLALAWVTGLWFGAGKIRVGATSLPASARDELRGPRWDSGQQGSLEPRA